MGQQDGIINDRGIAAMIANGQVLLDQPADKDQVQPASLDLRLGEKAYRIRASFLPGPEAAISDKLHRFTMHEFPLGDGTVLETGCVYLIPLMESLDLPAGLSASTNPKSSTGRLDIFVRVITDHARQFDVVTDGYQGPLYLEVSPRTFPVVVRAGSRLSQIRFRRGDCRLSRDELADLHAQETLVASSAPDIGERGIAMSIDLHGDETGLVGYRGKRHTAVVDVDKRSAHDRLDFWEPIYRRGAAELVLDPDEFYILVSREAVHVPPQTAAEMVPFDPLVGEFRVHYAGFFDPGFGHAAAGGLGSRAVLEVRSHEVPFIVEHGQIVGRLIYERMQARPEKLYGSDLNSNYQAQGLKLSKHFY